MPYVRSPRTRYPRALLAALAAAALLSAAPFAADADAGHGKDKPKLHKKSGGDGRKN